MSRVTEHLMRSGTGTLDLLPDTPLSVTNQIREWIDENDGATAVGAHVVITSTPIDASSITAAQLRSVALYAGPITARPTRTSVQFAGMKSWMDESALSSTINKTSGTPTQWVTDLVVNGLTVGTAAGGGSNVTRKVKRDSMSYGEALDLVASAGGWEYEVTADGSIDYGTIANLFGSTPSIVITDRNEGPDGTYRGVQGSMLDQALTQLGPLIPTKAVALGAGEGAQVTRGTSSTSRNLKTLSGGTPTLITVTSAPSEADADIDTVAGSILALQGMRRQVNVATSTDGIRRLVKPGEYVYLHDIATGLFDTSEQIQFRGETISPAKVRCLSLSWPIESTYGVYVVQNAASPTVLDVTRWVDVDDGDAFWTVGDWTPPRTGVGNRRNPLVEQRINAPANSSDWVSFTPSWVNFTIGNGTQTCRYRYTPGRMHLVGHVTLGSTSSVTGAWLLDLPNSESLLGQGTGAAQQYQGWVAYRDDSTGDTFHGSPQYQSSTRIRFVALDASATYTKVANATATVPFTWTNPDIITFDFSVPVA